MREAARRGWSASTAAVGLPRGGKDGPCGSTPWAWSMRRDLLLLVAAMRAYDRVHAVEECDDCGATWPAEAGESCRWCADRRDAQGRAVLRPPTSRGYGFATPADLAGLGIDPAAERVADLRDWARDLRMAAAAAVVTEAQADAAWASTERERQRAG